MLYFIEYDSTGKIICMGNNLPENLKVNTITSDVPFNIDINATYVVAGQLIPRPSQIIIIDRMSIKADGVDVLNITNALPGSTFTATGTIQGNTVTGNLTNPDTFSTEVADTYKLTISLWPYFDYTTTLQAI